MTDTTGVINRPTTGPAPSAAAPKAAKPKPTRSWKGVAALAMITLLVGVVLGALGTLLYQSWTASDPEPLRTASVVPAANSATTLEEACNNAKPFPLVQDGTVAVSDNLRVSTRWTRETATLSFANANDALVPANVEALVLVAQAGEIRVANLTDQDKASYFLVMSNADWGSMGGGTLYVCK